ncbi:MAG: AAA family ATPase [Acidobacteriaceae bacterium]
MTTKSHNSSPARFTVFTVCVDPETVANVMDGCAYAADTEFAGEFHDYMGRHRRPQFSQRVKDSAAQIALIDFDRKPDEAAQSAEILHQMFPGKIAIIAVSKGSHEELILQAMRAGCSEFLPCPFVLSQFTDMVGRLQSRFAILAPESAKNVGTVIALFGVKGGVGATTLAIYLATFLVRQHRKKVLLIDHHHQLGHVCLYLGLTENPYYFDELLRNVDRLDVELLTGFLTRHPSGLDVLPSPDTCAVRYSPSPHDMEHVLAFLRSEYDYVILDSSLETQNVNSAIIDSADEVYLVATPDVAALRDLSRHVENFGLDAKTAPKLRIAINRSSSNDAVSAEQVEAAVRFPVSVTFPNSYAELLRAINAGEPLSPQRRSEFTTKISKWANRLVHAQSNPETDTPKKRLFAFWK